MPVFTEVIPINNAAGASFQLPSTEDVKIMAVRASIDNGGGTDTQPELAMLAPTGAVIATERQSEAIPAGDSGMASWALRLAKKAGGGGGGAGTQWCVGKIKVSRAIIPPLVSMLDEYDSFSTNDASIYSLPDPASSGIFVNKLGVYQVTMEWFLNAPAGAPIASPWTKSVLGEIFGMPGTPLGENFSAWGPGAFVDAGNQYWHGVTYGIFEQTVAGLAVPLSYLIENLTGSTVQTLPGGKVSIVRLSD